MYKKTSRVASQEAMSEHVLLWRRYGSHKAGSVVNEAVYMMYLRMIGLPQPVMNGRTKTMLVEVRVINW